MGYYIQVPAHKDKAQQIVKLYGGRIIPYPLAFEDVPAHEALICVVDNGLFEAAAFCYDQDEFQAFSYPDGRPRVWVVIDRKKACELSGYQEVNP